MPQAQWLIELLGLEQNGTLGTKPKSLVSTSPPKEAQQKVVPATPAQLSARETPSHCRHVWNRPESPNFTIGRGLQAGQELDGARVGEAAALLSHKTARRLTLRGE